jgi:hypothetical protein
MKKAKFISYIDNQYFSYLFEDEAGNRYILDEDVCDVIGLSPAFHDQVGGLNSIKIESKHIDGKNYVKKIDW